MKVPLSNTMPDTRRKGYSVFLAFSWIVGLLLGSLAFLSVRTFPASMMRSLLQGTVSIAGSLIISLIPFLLSAASLYFYVPWLLLCVSFFKAFSLAFISAGICILFGSGGWLYRLLIMFRSYLCAPVLYGFWLCAPQRKSCHIGLVITALTAIALVCGFEHQFISPFLVSMITYPS